ncbi:hypothetical protein CALVIDRAFT_415598 [Calocera viscosa TUFC12733]|uniref:Uncharacterized protein n=1 Tax=Calocera viscosa (strain TUFC12733) TaxID=1330018 RepID=A0A167G0B8_CALVF|nr:hypothetical protein CALVIDRAFT_415598 [Calocera viscosa TUFC12733]
MITYEKREKDWGKSLAHHFYAHEHRPRTKAGEKRCNFCFYWPRRADYAEHMRACFDYFKLAPTLVLVRTRWRRTSKFAYAQGAKAEAMREGKFVYEIQPEKRGRWAARNAEKAGAAEGEGSTVEEDAEDAEPVEEDGDWHDDDGEQDSEGDTEEGKVEFNQGATNTVILRYRASLFSKPRIFFRCPQCVFDENVDWSQRTRLFESQHGLNAHLIGHVFPGSIKKVNGVHKDHRKIAPLNGTLRCNLPGCEELRFNQAQWLNHMDHIHHYPLIRYVHGSQRGDIQNPPRLDETKLSVMFKDIAALEESARPITCVAEPYTSNGVPIPPQK